VRRVRTLPPAAFVLVAVIASGLALSAPAAAAEGETSYTTFKITFTAENGIGASSASR